MFRSQQLLQSNIHIVSVAKSRSVLLAQYTAFYPDLNRYSLSCTRLFLLSYGVRKMQLSKASQNQYFSNQLSSFYFSEKSSVEIE